MLLASYLAAAASTSVARRGSKGLVSLRSFAAASISAGSKEKGGGSKKQQQQRRLPSSSPPPLPLPLPLPLPVVVLLGRPNVGKSALFNRLTGSRQALVRDTPGSHVTRDWRSSEAGKLGDLRFEVVDTSGLEEQRQQQQHKHKQKQTQQPTRRGAGGAVLDDGSGGGGLGSRAAALTAGLLRHARVMQSPPDS